MAWQPPSGSWGRAIAAARTGRANTNAVRARANIETLYKACRACRAFEESPGPFIIPYLPVRSHQGPKMDSKVDGFEVAIHELLLCSYPILTSDPRSCFQESFRIMSEGSGR